MYIRPSQLDNNNRAIEWSVATVRSGYAHTRGYVTRLNNGNFGAVRQYGTTDRQFRTLRQAANWIVGK